MRIMKLNASTEAHARELVAAIARTRPGLGIFQIVHDDDCKAIVTGRDTDCRLPCRPDYYLIELFAAPIDVRNN